MIFKTDRLELSIIVFQIKLCGIRNTFNQFTHMRFASWVNSDVFEMAAIAISISIYSTLARQSFFYSSNAHVAPDC